MTIEIVRYAPEHRAVWDALVDHARNGLFQFRRDYMDYHADRFEDLSGMALLDGEVVALLPASIDRASELATSHGGLTFGGVVVKRDLRSEVAIGAVDALLDGLRAWGASALEVRLLPQFLASYPSAEIDYALWRRGFVLSRRDLSSALPLHDALPLNSSKKQAVAKARKSGLTVSEGSLAGFHGLLENVLGERHGTVPVHRLDELEQLKAAFPADIILRSVESEGEMLAGILVFRYPAAWHTQYMAASHDGRKLGALDLVIASLIDEARDAGAKWLSFGASTTDGGRQLNDGLLWQKESFGARSVTHDFMRGTL